MNGRAFLVLVGLALAPTGCDCGSSREQISEAHREAAGRAEAMRPEAEAAVRRFFDAASGGDCETVQAMLTRLDSEGTCTEFLEQWNEHSRIELLDVPDVRVDGRDPSTFIVTTRVRRDGAAREMLVSATHSEQGWRVEL